MSKFLRQMAALSKKPADFKHSTPGIDSTPGVSTIPASESLPGAETIPGIKSTTGTGPTTDITPAPVFKTTPALSQQTSAAPRPAITSAPGIGSDPDIETVPGIKAPKPRLARLAQDGHSLGEQAVYQALWDNGTIATDGNRIIKVGFGSLTRLARLAERNCRLNVRSLIEKLAVEEIKAENCSAMEGKTYRIYSYSAILERRRAAGMLWVIRTKGVRFVSAPGIDSTPGIESISAVGSAPGAETSPDPGVDSAPGPGIESTPLYRNSFRQETQKTSSSQNSSVIVERLSRLGVKIDDDAATRIIRRCENANNSATVDEIAHFAELKVQQLAKRRNVENWVGMLISAVPAYFDAPATELQRYRNDRQREQARFLENARMILNDPEAPEHDKDWARGVIEQYADYPKVRENTREQAL